MVTAATTSQERPGPSHLNCPRCGLTIVPRVSWLAIRHCPRCLARTRTVVEMFSSRLPAEVLYAEGSLPLGDAAADRAGGVDSEESWFPEVNRSPKR
jgi:hypothetical protein